MKHSELYRKLGALLVAAAGFYIVLTGLNVSRTLQLLVSADRIVFAGGTLLLVFIYFLIGVRWRSILMEKDVAIRHRESFRQVLVTDFVNSFIPGRAGDIYRGYLASGEEKNTVETSIMVALERFMDFAAVTLLLLISLASFLPGSGFLIYPVVTAGVVLLSLLVLKFFQSFEDLKLPYIGRFYSRVRKAVVENFRTSQTVRLFTLTLIIWGLGIFRTAAVFDALGTSLSLGVVTVVTFLWAIISVIPLTPAGFGTTDAAIYLFLQGIGVSGSEAAAFIALNRLMLQGVPIILGGGSYLQRRI